MKANAGDQDAQARVLHDRLRTLTGYAPMMYVSRHHALDDLKADISLRLRPVCSHFPEAEFEALVDRIAGIEHKYAQKAAHIVPTSYFTERVPEKPDERG